MSDDVIDLEKARERRDAGDLPHTLQTSVIIRRGYGLATFCLHRETELDTLARIIRCRACGVDLDPIDVLGTVCAEWERLAEAIKERKRLEAENATLAAEEKRAKARKRTRVRNAAPVDGELAALRKLEGAIRRGYTGSVRTELADLDAIRKEEP